MCFERFNIDYLFQPLASFPFSYSLVRFLPDGVLRATYNVAGTVIMVKTWRWSNVEQVRIIDLNVTCKEYVKCIVKREKMIAGRKWISMKCIFDDGRTVMCSRQHLNFSVQINHLE